MPSPPDSPLTEAQRAFAQGDYARVIAIAGPLCAAEKAPSAALLLLANSAIASGDHELAIESLARLLQRQPDSAPLRRTLADLHNRRGAARRGAHDEPSALQDFEQALQLMPDHAQAGFNIALSLFALGDTAQARSRLDRHLQSHPGDVDARLQSIDWLSARSPQEAAWELSRFIASQPSNATSALSVSNTSNVSNAPNARIARLAARLGLDAIALAHLRNLSPDQSLDTALPVFEALRGAGDLDAARTAAEIGHHASHDGRRSPGLRLQLAGKFALPPIMRSHADIAIDRNAFSQALAQLDADWTPEYLAQAEPKLEQLAWSNFHLAYHGENDRDLQQRYARLIERAATVFAPALAERPAQAVGRRIGLLSSSWRECTAGAYFGGWIGWLRDAGFDVHLYQLGPQRDAATKRLAARASVFHFHDGSLLTLAEKIRSDRLDVLIYPELGMDARLLPFAALRLARRQAVGWGHPVTSGFSTFDGYFTCAEMEPANAASHYVEPLLPLPALGVDYARPALPEKIDRSALGLPSKAPLVLVPQSLFKLHPDNDAVLADLAARVPEAIFVLFEGEHPRWRAQWMERVAPAFAAHGIDMQQRLHWLPLGPRSRFLQVNRVCDLMLDSLRWSGGNTSLDALLAGLPVLSAPGDSMRARQSAAMLTRMGLQHELLCTPAQLAERAATMLRDRDGLATVRMQIASRLDELFDASAARRAFVEAIEKLAASP
jgi:predicted O-linked N-acetylglucosamine transferase (SPINDLY family)/thioredoxin-like negative regulator of GroEL